MENWVKLSVRYYADEKIEALPDADTELMFVRSLARAGELQLEGFIPEESLPKLARRRRYAASVEALLAAGLWTKVDGGFQLTNWDHWQDGLDALAKRRTADRERQRRRRASAGEQTPERPPSRDSGSRDHATSWDTATGMDVTDQQGRPSEQRKGSPSRDNEPLSRDPSRDVTATEGEGEEEKEGGRSRSNTHVARAEEPPSRCPEHINNPNPPACGGCAEARKLRNQWKAERARRLAEAPKCRQHRGEPAHNCGRCRSEAIAEAA